MTVYLLIKLIHILSSTILFGTGIGTAAVMYYGHTTRDPATIAVINRYVVIADWLFTGTSGVLQPLTGLFLVYLGGYAFSNFWVWGSIVGYLIAACCWFPVVYLQIQLRDVALSAANTKSSLPIEYYRYFRIWFWLGWPAFLSLLGVFYLMTAKPF